MRKIKILALIAMLALAACSRNEEPAFTPPAFSETAYALTSEADHIAVLELATNKLTRIKLDRQGADMAQLGNRIFVLSRDGHLAEIKDGKAAGWSRVTDHGFSLAAMDENTLIALGRVDIAIVRPGKGVMKRVALRKKATSVAYDRENNLIWLIDGEKGGAFAVSGDEFSLQKEIEAVGNSPHKARKFPGRNELWVAEGNEFMNGEPYGVGYAKSTVAMPGGINVVDIASGKQTDFIMVGGNVADLWISPGGDRMFAAASQYNEYLEASVSLIDPVQRRVRAEFRLCLFCHEERNVEPESGRALVSALAVVDRNFKREQSGK